VRVAVFISGTGTNLQALINCLSLPDIPASIELVIADSYIKAAQGLKRAHEASIPAWVVDYHPTKDKAFYEAEINKWCEKYQIDFIVLAGYMRILSPDFTKKWNGKLINVHPSLLPAFPGINAIQQAYDYGTKIIGVTVHYIDEGVDTGKIIDQTSCRVQDWWTFEEYEKQIHMMEHFLLPGIVARIAKQKKI